MIDRLLKHYKNSISTQALVFKYCRGLYRSFWIFFILAIISFAKLLGEIGQKGINIWYYLGLMTIIAISIVLFLYLNYVAKKIVKEKYNIVPTEFVWRNEYFDDYQAQLVVEFLKEQRIYQEQKLKFLIELIRREAEERRLPKFIAPGILIAFTVPVWIQVVIFKFRDVGSFQEAVPTGITLFILAVVTIWIMGWLKYHFDDFENEFLNRDSEILKYVAKLLEIVVLRFQEPTD